MQGLTSNNAEQQKRPSTIARGQLIAVAVGDGPMSDTMIVALQVDNETFSFRCPLPNDNFSARAFGACVGSHVTIRIEVEE